MQKGNDKLSNVFRRLIKKEFGLTNYNGFFCFFDKKLQEGKYDSFSLSESDICKEDIYHRMYELLKDKDKNVLKTMQTRLSDAMMNAVAICRLYMAVVVLYCLAMLVLVGALSDSSYFYAGAGVLTILFSYKTYEFLSNKFCVVDAHIAIIYKFVLEKLIASKKETWEVEI